MYQQISDLNRKDLGSTLTITNKIDNKLRSRSRSRSEFWERERQTSDNQSQSRSVLRNSFSHPAVRSWIVHCPAHNIPQIQIFYDETSEIYSRSDGGSTSVTAHYWSRSDCRACMISWGKEHWDEEVTPAGWTKTTSWNTSCFPNSRKDSAALVGTDIRMGGNDAGRGGVGNSNLKEVLIETDGLPIMMMNTYRERQHSNKYWEKFHPYVYEVSKFLEHIIRSGIGWVVSGREIDGD